MLFDLISFLGWPWLVAFHLMAVGLVALPFVYIAIRNAVARDTSKDRAP